MTKNGKFLKWKISFHHRSTTTPPPQPPPSPPSPPPEYICPICENLISDPVIVPSGHTFHRLCVQVCQNLNYIPTLVDGTKPDFSTIIPNLALRTAIPSWCAQNAVVSPPPLDYSAVETIVKQLNSKELILRPSERFLIDSVKEKPDLDLSHATTELTHRANRFEFNSSSSSSEESVIAGVSPLTLLPFATKPACWLSYPSTSSETINSGEILNPNFSDEEFIAKLKSSDPFDQEQGAISLRNVTRSDESARISLCTTRLLHEMKSLMISSYEKVQSNAIAVIVNLSLEKSNKVKIVRSGVLPIVIDLLKGRSSECQEISAGAIFSLSLEDSNKIAIGVLGALQPLLNCLLRSNSERTRCDSALALYHLSLVYSNRVKLVKLGAATALLTALSFENENVAGRILLVLCQLAVSSEGKMAMLDGNAVEHLVAMLRKGRSVFKSESTRENCVAALYALSHGSMRFKAMAKMVGMVEVLKEVEETGNERAKDKARRILMLLKGLSENGEGSGRAGCVEGHWEAIQEPEGVSRTSYQVGGGDGVGKSTDF